MAKARKAAGAATEPAPGMAIEVIPIAELHEDPANARRHSDRNIAAIKSSLARFGQVTPIVIDASNVVRKGNGTLRAARELGWETLEAKRTALAGVEAAAYAVADNRASELASWDDEVLASTLEAIRSEPDFPIGATGFEDAEIDGLLEKITREHAGGLGGGSGGEVVDDPAGEWEGMPEYQHEDQTSQFKVYVHIRNEEDLKDFESLIGQKVPRDRWAVWHPRAEIGRYADKRYTADGPGEPEGDGGHDDA
jgi:hypothetical protein